MRWINFILLLLLFLEISCNKTNLRKEKYEETLNTLKIPYFSIQDKYYFRGVFGYDSLCIPNNSYNYVLEHGFINYWETTTGTFTIGDTANKSSARIYIFSSLVTKPVGNNNLQIKIASPSEKSKEYTPYQLAEKYLKVGNYKIRGKETDENSNYEVSIRVPYDVNYTSLDSYSAQYFVFSSSAGTQHSSSFDIKEMSKTKKRDSVHYDLTFNINCNLFSEQFKESEEDFFGTIKGDFSTKISVPIR